MLLWLLQSKKVAVTQLCVTAPSLLLFWGMLSSEFMDMVQERMGKRKGDNPGKAHAGANACTRLFVQPFHATAHACPS